MAGTGLCGNCNSTANVSLDGYSNFTGSTTNTSTFYNYDYNYEEYTLPLPEVVSVALVYGTTLLLGILGNVLVIFTVTRFQRLKTITNTFLVSLASADLLVIVVCVPTKVCHQCVCSC